jgi:hypothetical protein
MKNKRSIYWACALVILAVVLLVVFTRRAVETAKQNDSTGAATGQGEPSSKAEDPHAAPMDTNHAFPSSSSSTSVPQSLWKTTAEQTREGLAVFNDAPIVFYGKVEDQFGAPLGNTRVTFSIQVYNGTESGVKNGEVIADANGFFTISGYKGERLSVKPQKAGYVIASLNCGGIYSTMYPEEQRAHPDPSNPVVIKMWKLQGAEPLMNISKEYKIHYTGEPIFIDLIAGKIVPSGGDLKITVSRPEGEVSEHNPQDWSLKIEAVDGGLIDSIGQDRITYEAPEGGYKPSYTFFFSTQSPYKWHGGFNNGFFVKSRKDNIYGKIGLSFGINIKPDDSMYIIFGGVANTNGSRNWEATAPK